MSHQLILDDGLRTLNLIGSGEGIWLMEFNPPLSKQERTYAEGPDSNGRRVVRSKERNAEDPFIKVGIGSTSESAFWDYMDNWQEMIASLNREKGVIRYIPDRNGSPVSFEVEAIEITEMPQDGAWLSRLLQTETTATFEAKPGGLVDPTVALTTSFTGPIAGATINTIGGHLRARGDLMLTDSSSQNRGLVEVGMQEEFDPATPESLNLTNGAGLTVAGTSGTSGAHGLGGPVQAIPTVVCATTAQPHKGLWRPKVRLWPYGPNALTAYAGELRVRLAYKIGDGPIQRTPSKPVPGVGNTAAAGQYYEVDFGPIPLDPLPSGHSWTGYIEAYATSGAPRLEVQALQMMPCDVYSKARAPVVLTPPLAVSAYSEPAELTNGPLVGKSISPASLAQTWGDLGSGDATDFDVLNGVIHRSATADTAARLDPLGSSNYGAVLFRATIFSDSVNALPGIFIRGTDAGNYAYLAFTNTTLGYKLWFKTRIGGNEVTIAKLDPTLQTNTWYDVQVRVHADGLFWVWVGPANNFQFAADPLPGYAASLASGVLASGKVGLFDFYFQSAPVTTRYWNHVSVSVPNVDAVIFSGRSAELRHDSFRRTAASGSPLGRVPVVEGSYLTLPPKTRANKPSRLVIAQRQYDTDSGLPSLGLSATLAASLTVTERVTLLSSLIAPIGFPVYTLQNVTADRTINANLTTIDELADVLGTLIGDYPLPIPAYTRTNVTTNRVLDCNSYTIDSLADNLCTLIGDLSGVPGAWTVNNASTNRLLNANVTTADALADILGTFIADLRTAGDLP